jgi:hypothetical protein
MAAKGLLEAEHTELGKYWLAAGPDPDGAAPQFLFTENETNTRELFGVENRTPYVKDAFNEFVVHGRTDTVNPRRAGTKAAALYQVEVPAGREVCLRLRLAAQVQRVGQASRLTGGRAATVVESRELRAKGLLSLALSSRGGEGGAAEAFDKSSD